LECPGRANGDGALEVFFVFISVTHIKAPSPLRSAGALQTKISPSSNHSASNISAGDYSQKI